MSYFPEESSVSLPNHKGCIRFNGLVGGDKGSAALWEAPRTCRSTGCMTHPKVDSVAQAFRVVRAPKCCVKGNCIVRC